MVTKLTRAFVSREQINKIANQVLGDLLPGQQDQSIYDASTGQNYEIGARLQLGERIFRYAQAGAAIVNPPNLHRLLVCKVTYAAAQDRVPDVIHPIGSTVIKLPDTNAAVNQYKNGWMEIWTAGGKFQFRRILSNTVSNGTYAWFTIDRGLDLAIAASGDQCSVHQNFYASVGPAGTTVGRETAMGMCQVHAGVALNSYFWLQTWGPAWVAATGTQPGAVANFRDVYMHSDGCINSANGETVGTTSPQRVGYAIETGTAGLNIIMLQLSP
jgi:hypothetical protein